MPPLSMDSYRLETFTGPVGSVSRTFDVYVSGDGPPIMIMQEVPGIGQEALRFAEKLKAAGFQVWLPHMFGPIGRLATLPNLLRVWCMRREFQLLSKDKSSAVVDWMRALCRHIRDERRCSGVGVVGMCLSGNFAMTMIADDAVLAAVAAQPSLPLAPGALHMSPDEIAAARGALDAKGPMYAYRFERDTTCTAARFDAIDSAFNDDAERVKLRALPGEGHSVFAIHFVDDGAGPTAQALDEIITYFRSKLS